MQCVRCTSSLLAAARPILSPIGAPALKRTFTALSPLRPSLSSLRPSTLPATTPVATSMLDLLPKPVAGPAMAATQIRAGPRDTFNPSHFVRKRRHGFLSRLKTRKGRALLQRRRLKKRNTLSH